MTEIITLLLISIIGIATGFFDSVIGAGGLISVPSLMFLGLPPQTAIATDRFGTLGQTATALVKYWKAKKIVWKYVPVLAAISFVGSLIGANILLNIDLKLLEKFIGVLMLVLLPVILLKRDIGIRQTKKSNAMIAIGLLAYFLIMIYGGLFGQGTGPILVYALTFFLGFTMIEVIATGVIPWLVLSISSVAIFALNGIINYEVGAVLLVSMAIGGYIGAHVALKKGDLWVKRLFALFVIIFAAKLLLQIG